METLETFKQSLLTKKNPPSKVTIKNYLSDVRKFIRWCENRLQVPFNPRVLTRQLISQYRDELISPAEGATASSIRSYKRYESSLKKFFAFLEQEGLLFDNPLQEIPQPQRAIDLWHLTAFKNYLIIQKAKPVTIKNYLADVRQFMEWFEKVIENKPTIGRENAILKQIENATIETYKSRMLYDAKLSPLSINRKLSSLRKYFEWAYRKNLIGKEFVYGERLINEAKQEVQMKQIQPVVAPTLEAFTSNQQQLKDEQEETLEEYSRFAPIRLAQKTKNALTYSCDVLFINPIASLVSQTKYLLWKNSGSNVFAPVQEVFPLNQKHTEEVNQSRNSNKRDGSANRVPLLDGLLQGRITGPTNTTRNIPKSMFSPLTISTKNFPLHKRLLHHLRYSRPEWYKRYHNHPLAHYVHFVLLVLFTTGVSFLLYDHFFTRPSLEQSVLSAKAPNAPPKRIAFHGKIATINDEPITAEIPLRFGIYNSKTASGSALLWQEVQEVSPEANGAFSVLLGSNSELTQELFDHNPQLYIGVTIKANNELAPRQAIATVGNAKDTEQLQGMKPSTDPNAGTSNVILALDSQGDLTIGGSNGHVFRATEGELTLSGETLTLQTNEGSNKNIRLNPDGSGIIDVIKPIQNTSNNGTTPGAEGAVEVADNLAVLANSSSQSALLINQNGIGDVISASAGGTAKFTLNGLGDGFFSGNVSLGGNSLQSSSSSFSLLADPINLTIGRSASALSLGANNGITSINNSLKVYGTTTLSSAVNTFGLLTAHAGITIPQDQSLTLTGFAPGSVPFIGADNKLASDSANFFWDQNKKHLGLGTNNPLYRLDIQDTQKTSSVAQIVNADTGSDADGLQIKLGNTSTTEVSSSNRFLTFETQGLGVVGSIQGNNTGVQFKTNGVADFAEYFPKYPNSQIPYGAIVCLDTNGLIFLCNNAQGTIVGITSKHPAFLGGTSKGENTIEVGLTGLVKTNVSTKNGSIMPGDMIAASTIPGVGVKATETGVIVGRAIEGFSSNDPDQTGSIYVSVNVGWYAPQARIAGSGNVTNEGETVMGIDTTTQTEKNTLATKLAEDVIEAQRIATETLVIGGKTIDEYIRQTVDEVLQSKVVALQQGANGTSIVSPLASDSAIAMQFGDDRITIHGDTAASTAAIAQIDNQGNASFSGTLEAQTIVANELALSEEGLQKLRAQILDGQSSTSAIAKSTTNIHQTQSFIDIASLSAQLAYAPNLESDFATFNQGLIALGPSSLSDVAITGNLAIGGNLKVTESTIDTIATDLQLQPLRQGNLSIMGGLVAIDTEGNLSVQGNAHFAKDVNVKGTLAANTLAPIPNQNLLVELSSADEEVQSGNLVVQNAEDEVARIDEKGNVSASGSGKFKAIAADAFKIVRGVQADTSLTETIASGSAGTAVIMANQKERTIFTPHVTKDSLIYLSATSDTQGRTPYIARQTVNNPQQGIDGSFTVQITTSTTKNIRFNWWIVN